MPNCRKSPKVVGSGDDQILGVIRMSVAGIEEDRDSADAADDSQPFPKVAQIWTRKLLRSGKGGNPKKTLANAIIPLKLAPEFADMLRYDSSALIVLLEKAPPWIRQRGAWQVRPWEDQDDRLFCEWLQQHAIDVGVTVARDAVLTVAMERCFHPIREYLEALRWDGVPRVSRWLTTYLGAFDLPYHHAIGARWLVSGVARVFKPGTKADCMLILEGPQGSGKSTALNILGGDWFTDEVGQLGSKDAAMSLAGRWIVEMAELESFKGSSLEELKAFLSRRIDRFRPPYGRALVDCPRQCIFAGTTNPEEYLHDATGNRRFWPVRCHEIDLQGLAQDRDQLWAEACEMFRQAHPIWLETSELRNLAAAAQEERFIVDNWEVDIAEWLERRTETTISAILESVFEYKSKEVSRRDQLRVSAILRRLGWERTQKIGSDGSRLRVFRKIPPPLTK